jgi:hypothetical protein
MRMLNTSESEFRTPEFGGLVVGPHETCEIEDGYCNARMDKAGHRMPSIAEQILTGFVPNDPKFSGEWGKHLRVTPKRAKDNSVAKFAHENRLLPAVAAEIMAGEVDAPKRRKVK